MAPNRDPQLHFLFGVQLPVGNDTFASEVVIMDSEGGVVATKVCGTLDRGGSGKGVGDRQVLAFQRIPLRLWTGTTAYPGPERSGRIWNEELNPRPAHQYPVLPKSGPVGQVFGTGLTVVVLCSAFRTTCGGTAGCQNWGGGGGGACMQPLPLG